MNDLLTPPAPAKPSAKITTAKLERALQVSFPLPEYATFFQVGEGTGGAQRSWADAVSMACWPSRGLLVWGFEIKASRSDWLREKKRPEKSMPVQKYCDRWCLVTGPGVITSEHDEIPATWGWMELVGGKLLTRKRAPELKPEVLDRPFLASLLRRCGQVSNEAVAERMTEFREKLQADQEDRITREVSNRAGRNSVAVEVIEKFKAATGIDLNGYNAETIGKEFGAFHRVNEAERQARYFNVSSRLRAAADANDAALAAMGEDLDG